MSRFTPHPGVTSVSFGGQQFNVIDDVLEVPDTHDEQAMALGYVPIPADQTNATKPASTVDADLKKHFDAPVDDAAHDAA